MPMSATRASLHRFMAGSYFLIAGGRALAVEGDGDASGARQGLLGAIFRSDNVGFDSRYGVRCKVHRAGPVSVRRLRGCR